MYAVGTAAVGTECPARTHWLMTKSKVTKIDYTWTIAGFTNLVREGWSGIIGPTIYARRCNVKWSLRMVPDSEGYLCLEIQSKVSVEAAVNACIYDVNKTKICSFGYTDTPIKFQPAGNGLRSRLISRAEILKNSDRYLSGDKLSVLCTLHYLQSETYAADQVKKPSVSVPPPDKASFMENVLTVGQFSDVVLVAEEREFTAHRAILAERSDVFQAMFHADMEEKRSSRVVMQDMTADAVSDLLTFIYTDTAPNVKTLALELFEAAEKYNIVRLKAVCEAELAEHLDINNIIDRLIRADRYGAGQLREAALYWITKHAPDITKTEHWETLCEKHPDLVKIICERLASYINHLKAGTDNM